VVADPGWRIDPVVEGILLSFLSGAVVYWSRNTLSSVNTEWNELLYFSSAVENEAR
jgi:hypothetical protein